MITLKIAVLGAGLVGRAIAYYVVKNALFDDIVIVDVLEENLRLAKKLVGNKAKLVKSNVLENIEAILDVDVVSCALPGSISFGVVKRLLGEGISVVDSSFMPQDPFDLDEIAKDNNVFYVPDAGFAPGLSNVLVGKLVSEVKHPFSIEIYVGGLPLKPEGLFLHKVNWSITDFLEEYTRPARIIKDGKVVSIDPLGSIEKISINGEDFEAFFTDGLRTLLKTINAQNMFEKTLRYPGHLERMRFLRDLGLLNENIIEIDGARFSARKFTIWLLRRHIYDPQMRDRAILLVRVSSRNKKKYYEVFVQDFFDKESNISAMARLTGFTNAIIASIMVNDSYVGVVPPEIIGIKSADDIIEKLFDTEGITIRTTTQTVEIKTGKTTRIFE